MLREGNCYVGAMMEAPSMTTITIGKRTMTELTISDIEIQTSNDKQLENGSFGFG